jgi:hypothetical protein
MHTSLHDRGLTMHNLYIQLHCICIVEDIIYISVCKSSVAGMHKDVVAVYTLP